MKKKRKKKAHPPPQRAFHNSEQYGAGFAGSAQRVPDNGWHLQMRSRVSTQARASLQLRSKERKVILKHARVPAGYRNFLHSRPELMKFLMTIERALRAKYLVYSRRSDDDHNDYVISCSSSYARI
ncbi:unnamed protein product [Trichogramma brassicae]|uniref:Uncharacterized protein n=1 Tax=Trichogramma brassicae TaxID=86971 RepID=A0A6H5J4R1_9HYME|nr:unnamed protein product [Trichogramma brassicae]